MIPACYEAVLASVRAKLQSRGIEVGRFVYLVQNSFALTSDLWTDVTLRSFICLTCSYIVSDDQKFMIRSTCVNIHNCTERHTGDNICDWAVGILSNMEIDVNLFDHCPYMCNFSVNACDLVSLFFS